MKTSGRQSVDNGPIYDLVAFLLVFKISYTDGFSVVVFLLFIYYCGVWFMFFLFYCSSFPFFNVCGCTIPVASALIVGGALFSLLFFKKKYWLISSSYTITPENRVQKKLS